MDFETIVCHIQNQILTVTLNRPDKLNAVTEVMLRDLNRAFQQAEQDTAVRVVVLTGAGRGFCSGADLAAAMEGAAETGAVAYGDFLRRTYNPLILGMRSLSKPIIGAVNGVAAGAGMSLALACDIRIAAESASFVQAFVRIGLVPDAGSTWLLPRLIGATRALEMMLTGRRIGAQEALQLGLVNQVVPDKEFQEVIQRVAQEFASAPTQAIGCIKQAFEFAQANSLAAALDKEAEMQDLAGATADHQEGVMAFLEKRPAQFKGH